MALQKIRNWYGKYERPISSISLVGGFIFDAVTLKRVDLFWENLWVIGHLVIVAVCMVWIHAIEDDDKEVSRSEAVLKAAADPNKAHFWLVNILQFFFGGILSTYIVFYFRSADIFTSWPFLVLLVVSFWANEALKRSFVRLSFQVAQFFLSVFAFAIYLLPILLHKISDTIFILSGLVSLIFIWLFLWVIKKTSGGQFRESKTLIFGSITIIYLLVNIFYFTNLIPPIPLSVKEAGVYHSVVRNKEGNYDLETENYGWSKYFTLYPNFHLTKNQPVYVYTAVFSPADLNVKIFHEWQHKNEQTGKWEIVDKISLSVVGGREEGFRTYSKKTSNLIAGKWRVTALNERGQAIGGVRFNLVYVDNSPETTTVIGE